MTPKPLGENASLVGRTIGRYRVTALLGRGGMGAVYAADDPSLGRRVALKVLEGDLVAAGERRARFFREARGAAAATHENIAAVYEVGEADGLVFLAMELVEGRNLREVMIEHPAGLPILEVVRVGRGIARGLAKAHDAGVIHRDLKPENVMLGEEERVKILDFGIAKLRGEREGEGAERFATQEGRILGTPYYMSPEQAAGRAIDERSDLFSLGVVLFEMATGRRPFEGETPMLVLVSLARDEPPLPSSLRPDLPIELEGLIARCLLKDAALRPASAREVGEELQRCGQACSRDPTPSGRASGPRADAEALGSAPTLLEMASTLQALPGATDPTVSIPIAPPAAVSSTTGEPTLAYDNPTLASGPAGTDGRGSGAGEVSAPAGARGAAPRRLGLIAIGTVLALAAVGIWSVRTPSVEGLQAGAGASATAPATSAAPPPPALRFRALTSNPADVQVGRPSLSPDGQSFVYVVGWRVYRQSFSHGARQPVPIDGVATAWEAACLPDGDLLVSGVDTKGKPGLWRCGGAGEAPVRLRDETLGALQLSHGGSLLVREREEGVFIESLDGRERRLLRGAKATPGLELAATSWSPDDRAVALIWTATSRDKLDPVLEIVSVDGSGAVTLLRDQRLFVLGGLASVTWLDAGRLAIALAGTGDGGPGTGLHVQPLRADFQPAGEASRVHDFPGESVVTSGYDPVARRLVLTTATLQQDVLTAPLLDDGRRLGAAVRLTLDDRNDRPTGWLPDGRVLFMSDRAGNWDVFAQRQGGEPDALTSGPDLDTWPTAADGGAVLAFQIAAASHEGKCPIVRREPSGALRPLLDARCEASFPSFGRPPPAAATMACFHRTPERCLLGERSEAHLLLTPFDARTGARVGAPIDTGIPAEEAGDWAISPDDREVAVAAGEGRIAIVQLARQAAPTLLRSGFSMAQYPTWTPSGAGVIVAGMALELTNYGLVRVDRSGRVDPLLSSDTKWISQPHASPDGKTLAFGMVTYDTDVGCLEGL